MRLAASLPFPPRAHDVNAPDHAHCDVTDDGGGQSEHEATQQKRLPHGTQLVEQPFNGQLEVQVARCLPQCPRAGLVGGIKYRRHGDRVGHPHQRNRDRQVAADDDGQGCRQEHLEGHRHEGDEQAGRHTPGNGVAVQVPEIAVVQQLTEQPPQSVLSLRRMEAPQYSLQNFILAWMRSRTRSVWAVCRGAKFSQFTIHGQCYGAPIIRQGADK